jgi:hypothetical protein
MIQPKAEGVEILTQEPPEIPVIPLNPTAQQRKDFEKATKDLIKLKSAESKEVALVVQSCFSTQQATGVLTRPTREAHERPRVRVLFAGTSSRVCAASCQIANDLHNSLERMKIFLRQSVIKFMTLFEKAISRA